MCVHGRGALVRRTAELDSAKVVQLPPGTELDGFESARSSTGVARTRIAAGDGVEGWVSAKTLEPVPPPPAAPAAPNYKDFMKRKQRAALEASGETPPPDAASAAAMSAGGDASDQPAGHISS